MRFLPRLTYANVVATLAIFIALGGISYAATNLGKNSVGTKQIKKKAVTTAKIKKKAVTRAKIKKNAVATAKIKKNAVTGAKIKKNAVTGAKIRENAVATSKIANEAVTQGKVDPNLLASIDEEAKLKVFNEDGSVLGTFAGVLPSGFPIFQVIIDGGIYSYYPSGQAIPFVGPSPVFKTNTCDGTAYVESDEDEFDLFLSKLAGGPTRVVFRTTTDTVLGPISAWQFTKASENVAGQNLWELNSTTGACVLTGSSPFTGVLVALDPVTAPPDGIGPLTIG